MLRLCFNPRSREGNDSTRNLLPIPGVVSIHVPAKGTTRSEQCVEITVDCFNPRSREGNDSIDTVFDAIYIGFNPRSREGNDGSKSVVWI